MTGFLISTTTNVRRSALEDLARFCRLYRVPAITITKATHYKVTVAASTMPEGRFRPDDLPALQSFAEQSVLTTATQKGRMKVLPVRVTVWGLTREEARALGNRIAGWFPPLDSFAFGHPEEEADRAAARQVRPPRSASARSAQHFVAALPLVDQVRVRHPAPIDLAAERRKRRRDDPWNGGAA